MRVFQFRGAMGSTALRRNCWEDMDCLKQGKPLQSRSTQSELKTNSWRTPKNPNAALEAKFGGGRRTCPRKKGGGRPIRLSMP
jgi:hypothetical protein